MFGKIKYLSQRDPHWGEVNIGQSPLKIKDYGCTLTCVSMASMWFNCYHNPEWMAKNLSFTKDGKILWQSINKLCFQFIWRFYGLQEKMINAALAHPSQICLLEIRKVHWVLGLSKWGNYYRTADPWNGTTKLYHKSYVSGGSLFDVKQLR